MIFSVKFPSGYERAVFGAADEADAMSQAFKQAVRPIWCLIHEGIAESSNAPVGQMGFYFPPSAYPVSAKRMREVYMGGGYCLIPCSDDIRRAA